LRQAITEKLATDNAVAPEGYDIVVTAGSNMGFFNAILAVCDPEDEVILLTPWYFNHEMAIRIAGCVPVSVPTDEEFQPDPAAIAAAITPRTRAVVTISPNNPTGAVYSSEVLDTVNNLCADREIFHIHDEAYEYFVYGGARHYSPSSRAGAAGHTISLFSLSKTFSLASWRIGYMLIPSRLKESVRKIQDTNLICPPVVSQFAAVEAMRAGKPYCDPSIAEIGAVREHVLERLRIVSGVEVNAAAGAFYVLLHLTKVERTDLEIVEELIRNHGVAVIPGSAFGIEHGCYLRISYGALEPQKAREGIDRLCAGLENLACG
jgi:aspartate/methionine/tyrosine aminotransferase